MTGDKKKSPKREWRAHPGITLMELLVVLGVFSVTVMLTSAIFLQANAVQRRVLLLNSAQADLRFALEAMVREVRMGGIDYEAYAGSGGVEIPSDRLAVSNPFGQSEVFFREDDPSVCPEGVDGCLAVSLDGGQPESMSSRALHVDRVLYYLSPAADPYALGPDGAYLSDLQPTVTIVIEARTAGVRPEDVLRLNAQTTVTARTYVR